MATLSIEQEIAKNARIANMIISQFSKSDLMPFIPDNYEIARQRAIDIINGVSDSNDVLTTFKYSKKIISKLSDSDKRLYNKALNMIAMMNKKTVYTPIQEARNREIDVLKSAGYKYKKGVLSTISTEFRDLFAVLSYAEIQKIKEQVLSNPNAEFEDILVEIYDEMSKYKQEELKKLKATQRENIKNWGENVFSSKQLRKNPHIERMLQGLI